MTDCELLNFPKMEEIKKESEESKSNVWFTSDFHFGHKNILIYEPGRIKAMDLSEPYDIQKHNDYIINMVNRKVNENDYLFILGDFIFGNQNEAIDCLNRIKCKNKFFINGNHDKTLNNFDKYFIWKKDIKNVTFLKKDFTFLHRDFEVCMCHYPLKSWPGKSRGAMNLYGHVHSHYPQLDKGNDLCFNVGIDNPLANYEVFSLQSIYEFYYNKLNGMDPREYVNKVSETDQNFVI